jgi:hypothetical protein
MKAFLKILPWLFVSMFSVEVVIFLPKKEGEMHARVRPPAGALNGRIQPFDSVARNSLLQIRSTGDVPLEEIPPVVLEAREAQGDRLAAEVMLKPDGGHRGRSS